MARKCVSREYSRSFLINVLRLYITQIAGAGQQSKIAQSKAPAREIARQTPRPKKQITQPMLYYLSTIRRVQCACTNNKCERTTKFFSMP